MQKGHVELERRKREQLFKRWEGLHTVKEDEDMQAAMAQMPVYCVSTKDPSTVKEDGQKEEFTRGEYANFAKNGWSFMAGMKRSLTSLMPPSIASCGRCVGDRVHVQRLALLHGISPSYAKPQLQSYASPHSSHA